ncbi:uncharacterized [Tachysurus ichikawai]
MLGDKTKHPGSIKTRTAPGCSETCGCDELMGKQPTSDTSDTVCYQAEHDAALKPLLDFSGVFMFLTFTNSS